MLTAFTINTDTEFIAPNAATALRLVKGAAEASRHNRQGASAPLGDGSFVCCGWSSVASARRPLSQTRMRGGAPRVGAPPRRECASEGGGQRICVAKRGRAADLRAAASTHAPSSAAPGCRILSRKSLNVSGAVDAASGSPSAAGAASEFTLMAANTRPTPARPHAAARDLRRLPRGARNARRRPPRCAWWRALGAK